MILKVNNGLSYSDLKKIYNILSDFMEIEEDRLDRHVYPSGEKYKYKKLRDLQSEVGRVMAMRLEDTKKMGDIILGSKPGHYLVTYRPLDPDGMEEKFYCSTDEDLRTIPNFVK